METMIDDVKTNMQRVYDLLLQKPEYRDSDTALYAKIAWRDMKKSFPTTFQTMTAKELLQAMKDSTITPFETIRRCRQKCQQIYPETRGVKYKQRHKADDQFKQEIRNVA